MAAEAGDYRLIGKLRRIQPPRTSRIEGRDKVTDAAFEMHPVASQAIVHQQLAVIMFTVQENIGVSGAVSPRAPIGVLFLVTFLAARNHLQNIAVFQLWLFRRTATQVRKNAAHVVDVESRVECKDIPVAVGTGYVPMSGIVQVGVRLPDFVATYATIALGALKVQHSAAKNQQWQGDRHKDQGEARELRSETLVCALYRRGRMLRNVALTHVGFQFAVMNSEER